MPPAASRLSPLPASREAIRAIQSARKRVQFDRAKKAAWYKGKLDHIDPDRLDDPDVWRQIPIIDKDILRQWTHDEFMTQINIAGPEDISEYWRSGGSTGKPVFYPRTFEDVTWGLESWARNYACTGIKPGDLCHISFPLGIHPAGQIWARSAHLAGIGMNWVGAGNSVPSAAQLDLIAALKPTVLVSMPSFALHMANLADSQGIELADSSIRTIVTSAETLSEAKREKLKRMWGADVYDVFGMSEAGLMGAEGPAHDGIHIWSDLYFCEVIDPESGRPVPDGEVGTFCVTPLFTGNATPFLRWNSGDQVRWIDQGASETVHAELFPMIRHAARTTGFFKIRGVNVNHAEFEDFIFGDADINDFQGVMMTDDSDLETLEVRVEVKRGIDPAPVAERLQAAIKQTFEVRSRIRILESGALAKAFESSLKAPRFVDERDQ